MKETIKLGLTLFLITAVAALVLAMSYDITERKVAEMAEAEADLGVESRIEAEILNGVTGLRVLDEEETKELIGFNEKILEICEAYNDSELIGYAITANTSGFKGRIEFILGISIEGKITGLRILDHGETPGIGSNVAEPRFYENFHELPVDKEVVSVRQPKEDNEIKAITGASFTTDGVIEGVNMVRQFFVDNLAD